MELFRPFLRVVGYLFLTIFTIQLLNIYFNWFVSNNFMFMPSLYIGIGALFILVLIDRLVSKEDNYYEKNVEK
ncbi:MAG: hypothetical protein NZ825_13925 [Candidatus Marinimicrobia bacterium]|nr:hypothetical protein [Candidatus Neomarinimicrobiota bacterium]